MKFSAVILFIVFLLALVSGAIFYFRDTDGPQISLSPETGSVSDKRPLALEVEDSGSGVKHLLVTALQKERSFEVLTEDYGKEALCQSRELALGASGIEDGPLEIRITATDHSIFHFGAGNRTEKSFFFNYDSKPPLISILSTAHNVNRGGSGLIVYTLSEEAARTGVEVGDLFFPGYQQESGLYAALFAFPFHMEPVDFTPKIVAKDEAGNERRSGFYYHTKDRTFRQRRINISPQFLEVKAPEFHDLAPQAKTPLEAFLQINQELRSKNRRALYELGLNTSPKPLWQGSFLRQPNTATMALFGDDRTYYFEGKKIDRQTHLGIDLASVAHAPISAANAGQVIFTDYMGIYGQCVIIDHGLGLQTLYAHLSRIDVHCGDKVEKGQVIGRTGTTGMAGGDHLHFGVILSGLPVNPIEWWDGSWLRNNVSGKLDIVPPSSGR